MAKEQLQEFKADDKQSEVPDPIGKDAHSNRPADKADNGQTAPLQFATKVEAINTAVSMLAAFETQQIADFLANVGQGNPHAKRGLDKKGELPGTVEWKGAQLTKEDVDSLLSGSELTEEQQERVRTIFEAAVETKLISETARLDEEFETKLVEAVDGIRNELKEDVDQFLGHVAEKWLEENQAVAEQNIKVAMAENFMKQLVALMTEHNIVLPESVDVFEDLNNRLEVTNKQLAEAIKKIDEQADVIFGYEINEKFLEVTEGLALTQVEKLRSLAENIEAETADEFATKLTVIKEAFVRENKSPAASADSALTEEFLGENEDRKPAAVPHVSGYAAAIKRQMTN
jgi:hypothetical protein